MEKEKTKSKKVLKHVLIAVFSVIVAVALVGGLFALTYKPSLTANFGKTYDLKYGASGYLYGVAEPGVPSSNMTESVDISTVAQKVPGGLQHPIGDLSRVESQLANTKYDVVYLQDAYDTWYYKNDDILKARKANTYDWKSFVEKDYLPRVKQSVEYLTSTAYSKKVVYCLYNECDNGVWFGSTVKDDNNSLYGVRGDFDQKGQDNFFAAWKMTYDYVKKINPDAIIGGPGYFEYNHQKMLDFMSFCKENDCVPDVVIYHELYDNSIYFWQDNVDDYRYVESDLGIKELPIIITEYGTMQDCGQPGTMLKYITQIEKSHVYADMAYWRLADNLCDVAADDNSPNSNWWLYRWYSDMNGKGADIKYSDIMRSNMGKAIKSIDVPLRSKGFMGVASIDDKASTIKVICGGRDGDADVKLRGLNMTSLAGKEVCVTVEETVYKGLSGVVNEPVELKQYKAKVSGGRIKIQMNNMDAANAYHITIKPWQDGIKEYDNTSVSPKRYEAETGTLLGSAYTYDSAYATTGGTNGMVGGMEKDSDGVKIPFEITSDGNYKINIIYGKNNDGESPNDRRDAIIRVQIDDGESQEINLNNTIDSNFTDCYVYMADMKKGSHSITLMNEKETYVVDSIVVEKEKSDKSIYVMPDDDRSKDGITSYLAVAPDDGYYKITTDSNVNSLNLNDLPVSLKGTQGYLYLQRGLNYVDIQGTGALALEKGDYSDGTSTFESSDIRLKAPALLKSDDNVLTYIDGISCNGGNGKFKVKADKSGTYFITFCYANNDEGGVHDYNIDLIERYITVSVGGKSQDVYCRNTYSWSTFKTVTAKVELKKGDNTITLSNSGNNKFNAGDTYAPYIKSVSVSAPVK